MIESAVSLYANTLLTHFAGQLDNTFSAHDSMIDANERDTGVIFKLTIPSKNVASIKEMSENPPTVPIHFSGWLKKMKRSSKMYAFDWNKRWITIEDDAIQWRHSKEDDISAGLIELSHIERVYRMKALKSKRNNVFIVKSKKRTLCLMASSPKDCDQWVRSIQLQLDLRQGGTFSGPKSSKNRRKSNGGSDKFERMMKTVETSIAELTKIQNKSHSPLPTRTSTGETNCNDDNPKIQHDVEFNEENDDDTDSVSSNNRAEEEQGERNVVEVDEKMIIDEFGDIEDVVLLDVTKI